MEAKGRRLSNAELAVLGLLAERGMHGYEIESVIRERGMRNWTEIGFSSIYRVLGSLEREGLVRSRTEPAPGKGPARKVYEALDSGRERYREECLAALGSSVPPCPLFMQGLAALPALGPEAAARALGRYRVSLAERLAEIEAKDAADLPFHAAALFSYSKTMILAEDGWVEALERKLRARARRGGRT